MLITLSDDHFTVTSNDLGGIIENDVTGLSSSYEHSRGQALINAPNQLVVPGTKTTTFGTLDHYYIHYMAERLWTPDYYVQVCVFNKFFQSVFTFGPKTGVNTNESSYTPCFRLHHQGFALYIYIYIKMHSIYFADHNSLFPAVVKLSNLKHASNSTR